MSSKILRAFGWLFIVQLIALFIAIWVLRFKLEQDCLEPRNTRLTLADYSLQLNAQKACR